MQDKIPNPPGCSSPLGDAETELRAKYTYLAKDFVETKDGYFFALVANGIEQDRVLAWLRYQRQGDSWQKFSTSEATETMHREMSAWQFNSQRHDAQLHGIPVGAIYQHHRPSHAFQTVNDSPAVLLNQVRELLAPIASNVGLTGSRLIGAQQPGSDIDLVIYGRDSFFVARQLLQNAVADRRIGELTASDWENAYKRRGCSLGFEQYVWHERRKANKFQIDGTKIDISMSCRPHPISEQAGKKLRKEKRLLQIVNDEFAFATPALYGVDSPVLSHILVCTPTYAAQAWNGEWVEASGWIEEMQNGSQRLVVGSSRESPGEYLRVIEAPKHF